MPEVPSWILADSQPGQNASTNEAMPRFGGRANPGETIKISVDGETTSIQPTPNGTWEWTSPELENGSHDFEMWSEDAEGNESDHVDWENHVEADAQTREWQRARNQQWNEQGARDFLDQNDALTPPRPITGGGGGGGAPQPMTDPVPGSTTGTPSSTTGAGSSAGGGTSPQGLEKGNALQVG